MSAPSSSVSAAASPENRYAPAWRVSPIPFHGWESGASAFSPAPCAAGGERAGLVDRGVVARPLTAGIVRNPVAQYGSRLAARAGREPGGLMELRLDFEDASGLVARFNAVAETIRLVRPVRRRRPARPRVRPRPPNS